eukprot:6571151-Lingulodinium_polyedra.AAC.1
MLAVCMHPPACARARAPGGDNGFLQFKCRADRDYPYMHACVLYCTGDESALLSKRLPTIPKNQLTCDTVGASGYMLSRGQGWSPWEL